MNKYQQKLLALESSGNLRVLNDFVHEGIYLKPLIPNAPYILNFASNDYLSLSTQSQAFLNSTLAKENIRFSSSSSRLLSGGFDIAQKLEALLESKFGKSCLLFNSGYSANIGLMESLARLELTLFLLDEFAHASIIDGIKLSRAHFRRYKHNNMLDLETKIQQLAHKYQQVIVVTEALFSMEGDLAFLLDIVALKKKYKNVKIYLDEAHSIGAYGNLGLGLAKELGCEIGIDFIMLAFGKAIASVGACILCEKDAKEYFVNSARSLIYSTALPPLNIAFSYFIFQKLAGFSAQRARLQELSMYLNKELHKLCSEFESLSVRGDMYIVSLILESNERVQNASTKLLSHNIYAPSIRYPTVPKNTARLRFSLNAGMDKSHITQTLEVLESFLRQEKLS